MIRKLSFSGAKTAMREIWIDVVVFARMVRNCTAEGEFD